MAWALSEAHLWGGEAGGWLKPEPVQLGGEKQTRQAHRPSVWARPVPNALLLGQGLAAWVGVFRWLQGWAGKETAGADDMSLWGGDGAMEKDSFGVQEIKWFLCEG